MRILITGANGMLAQTVKKGFAVDMHGKKNELILTDIGDLDITDEREVMAKVMQVAPQIVINCAAFVNADRAEEEAELAYNINSRGPENLAVACRECNAVLVHISSDYVFGGELNLPSEYLEDDKKMPLSVYGKSKLDGERRVAESGCKYYIFRTAWLYGDGPNFVRTMLKIGNNEDVVDVVNDQHGSPTYAEDLVAIMCQVIYNGAPYGVYNATNVGNATWADFARKIFELAGVNCAVRNITSEEWISINENRTIAPRPKNSQMSKRKLLDLGIVIPKWEDGLARYLKKEKQNEK